jgi:hypothetical protein
MILVRVPQLLDPENRMLCLKCSEPVEWVGRWRHYNSTWCRGNSATYPRFYYKERRSA